MQIDLTTNEQLAKTFQSGQNIAIVPSEAGGLDAFCAAVSLYLMLLALDKSPKILYRGEAPSQCASLIKEGDVVKNFSQRQLVVSIDYSQEKDAKAWYEPEDNILKVKLAPVSKDYDVANKVKVFVSSGFDYDTCVILGANDIESLGPEIADIKDDLYKSVIVNISNNVANSRFGSVNVIDSTCESLCHLIVKKASLWELNITSQAAQALLFGISQDKTQN